jgi:glucokinase
MLRAGVDLGGTKIQSVITDPRHRVLGTDRRPTPTEGGPDDVTDVIADSIRAAIQDAHAQAKEIGGVGVGAPGQIDPAAGTLSNAGNLPGWMLTYPLATELTNRVKAPVVLGNDVQVGVNAEVHLGAGRSYKSLLGVFCGTGVGGGVVIDREIWIGAGAAGEIGHVCIQAENGALCTCGRHGCMEAYAGRAAMEIQAREWRAAGQKTKLFKIMKQKGKPRLASGVWDKALRQNDVMAQKLIRRAIWALGAGIASAVNVLDVEAVVIGGGLGIRLGQPFVDEIQQAMLPHLIRSTSPQPVVLAELGDMGGALGATLLVQKLVEAPQGTPRKAAKKTVKKAPAKTVKKTARKAAATAKEAAASTTKKTAAKTAG